MRYFVQHCNTSWLSLLQASGEAQYTDDIPKQQGELYGAFVTTTKVTQNTNS
jgi:xanthine dehydrogenase molybdopterin-binding subunit B